MDQSGDVMGKLMNWTHFSDRIGWDGTGISPWNNRW